MTLIIKSLFYTVAFILIFPFAFVKVIFKVADIIAQKMQ